jgi:hypothetical protein
LFLHQSSMLVWTDAHLHKPWIWSTISGSSCVGHRTKVNIPMLSSTILYRRPCWQLLKLLFFGPNFPYFEVCLRALLLALLFRIIVSYSYISYLLLSILCSLSCAASLQRQCNVTFWSCGTFQCRMIHPVPHMSHRDPQSPSDVIHDLTT